MPEKDSRKNELTSKNDKNFSAQINKEYDDEINIFELLFKIISLLY